jgi:hypothetical protein
MGFGFFLLLQAFGVVFGFKLHQTIQQFSHSGMPFNHLNVTTA